MGTDINETCFLGGEDIFSLIFFLEREKVDFEFNMLAASCAKILRELTDFNKTYHKTYAMGTNTTLFILISRHQ